MKIVNISVNSTDPKTMIPPAKELIKEYGLDIDLHCWDSYELDDDLLKYQELLRITKDADLIIMRCMTDPTRLNRFEKYEGVLKETKGLVFIHSGNADVKFVYRDLFSGTDEEFVELGKYVGYRGAENDKGLILWLNRRLGGPDIAVPEPVKQRSDGIYHPDHSRDVTLEDYLRTLDPEKLTAGLMFTGSSWLFENTLHIDSLIRSIESKGLNVIPVFFSTQISSSPDGEKGTSRLVRHYLMDGDSSRIDVLIMASPFSQLVNSRDSSGMSTPDDENFYRYLTNVPVIQAMTVSGKYTDYEDNALGLNKNEIYAQVSWPEVDGQIISVPIGASEERSKSIRKFTPIDNRIEHISDLAKNWAILRNTPISERKVAILLYQSRPDSGRIGSAAGLDTLESVSDILQKMSSLGYDVDNVPSNGKELITELLNGVTNDLEWMSSDEVKKKAVGLVAKEEYLKDFDPLFEFNKKQITENWGEPIGSVCVDSDKMVIPGVIKGNVFIGYQPLRAWFDQMDAVYHDPIMPMPHQYLEYYRWLQNEFGVQVVVHVGTHGTLEWLPGKNVGMSGKCYPDVVLNSIPHIYPYVIDDPGEGIQTKRRSEAVVIGHMCPTMARAGTYDDLAPIEVPLQEYFRFRNSATEDRKRTLVEEIYEAAKEADLFDDLGVPADMTASEFDSYLPELHDYLTEVREALVRDGLHIMGRVPAGNRLHENIYSLMRLRNGSVPSLRTALSGVMGIDIESALDDPSGYTEGELNSMLIEKVDEAYMEMIIRMGELEYDTEKCLKSIEEIYGGVSDALIESLGYACKKLIPNLRRMTDEVTNLLDGFDGQYVLPGPSGAPTRGGADLLPMGRNYYGVDPSMVPSRAAWSTGVKMAEQMIAKYVDEKGHYPKEVGFIIWATDTMKTSGDDLAYILWLMGIRPVWSKISGHVIDLEVVPISELKRPRLDVTVRITGLFRDTFPNLIDIIDDAVKIISELDEGEEENYLAANLRKDIIECVEKGIPIDEARRRSSVRVFGSPPGAYGPGVNHAIESGEWKTVQDLADIYVSWGSYGYGRDLYGEGMKEEFVKRFSKVGVTIKNMPDREIDLLDIDDVYGYLGGLNAFVKTYGDPDAMSFMGDSSDPDKVKIRETKEEMRFVFRSKILNPKFLNGLKEHGYRGVTELAKLTEYMLGWDATSDAIDDWMYEKVSEKFLFDEDTRKWMEEENPYAVMDMLNRLQEAISRGLWDAKDTTLEKLEQLYLDLEERLEMLTDRDH